MRILGQSPRDDRLLPRRQGLQIWGFFEMLRRQPGGGDPIEGKLPSQHFLINNGQTVLIRMSIGLALKQFRGGINRRQPVDERC